LGKVGGELMSEALRYGSTPTTHRNKFCVLVRYSFSWPSIVRGGGVGNGKVRKPAVNYVIFHKVVPNIAGRKLSMLTSLL
jgi:hypothetical protein